MTFRKGIRTSEFWFSVAGSLVTVVAAVAGAPIAAVGVAGMAVAYTVSRGIAKARGGDVAGAVAEALKAAQEAKALAEAVKNARK